MILNSPSLGCLVWHSKLDRREPYFWIANTTSATSTTIPTNSKWQMVERMHGGMDKQSRFEPTSTIESHVPYRTVSYQIVSVFKQNFRFDSIFETVNWCRWKKLLTANKKPETAAIESDTLFVALIYISFSCSFEIIVTCIYLFLIFLFFLPPSSFFICFVSANRLVFQFVCLSVCTFRLELIANDNIYIHWLTTQHWTWHWVRLQYLPLCLCLCL